MIAVASPYDAAAPSFDRHRALPGGVPEAIRAAILGAVAASPRPRLLDLGAGTGRIGRPFVAAGDDYVGVDLSLGMLREFARRAGDDGRSPRLLRADGERLPFGEGAFDAVLLIQVIGAARKWQKILSEARRVLKRNGALVVGHAVTPPDGIDAQMKGRLASLLHGMGVSPYHADTRGVAQDWFESVAYSCTRIIAAEWTAERTPRTFLDRQRTGARFSALPGPVKDEALGRLAHWAAAHFGSLDAVSTERHAFELRVFRFQESGSSGSRKG
jgi:ubiquinone/menaquinone biosynthesis C-methylase UbiE